MNFKIGQTVRVIRSGESYPYYTEMSRIMGLTKWSYTISPQEGIIGTIINMKPVYYADFAYLYAIRVNKQEFIVNKRAIEVIERPLLKEENFTI